MTSPSGGTPPGSASGSSGTGLAAWSAKTGQQWKNEATNGMKSSYETNFFASWIGNLFGGFGNGIAGLINLLLSGVFGIVGGIADLIGGFLNIRKDVHEVKEVEVPRLDNRIDELAGGVTQYTFGSTGTFTKPAGATRISVTLVGGSAGGSRYTRTQQPGGGCGGWTRWYDFLASEVPSSVTVTIGNGGAGGTSDNTLGGTGGDTSFGDLLTAGGGRCLPGGAQPGYGTELYYDGSGGRGGQNGTTPALAGGNGPFSQGGSPGGAQGANGASPSSDLVGPGSGGGGGGFGGQGAGGGHGGHGGYPGGGGGAGGNYNLVGFIGNGGNGTPGAAWVRVYFN